MITNLQFLVIEVIRRSDQDLHVSTLTNITCISTQIHTKYESPNITRHSEYIRYTAVSNFRKVALKKIFIHSFIYKADIENHTQTKMRKNFGGIPF